jgi:hypothetical protein
VHRDPFEVLAEHLRGLGPPSDLAGIADELADEQADAMAHVRCATGVLAMARRSADPSRR